jgi:hypothetical protein
MVRISISDYLRPLPFRHLYPGRETSVKLDGIRSSSRAGDLSHMLKDDRAVGYAPDGPEFDKQVTGP